MARICIVGGAGFIGQYVTEALVRDQHVVIIPTRKRERAKRDLIMLPTVKVVEANVHDDATLARLFEGCDAVINLTGILHSRPGTPYGAEFARVHVELPKRIVAACLRAGVRRLLHVSALGASPNAPSEYLRSKADGEAAVLGAGEVLKVTVFRPAVVFGEGDSFLGLFAAMQRWLPFIALASSEAKFQPVFIKDVANAIAASLADESSFGKTWELAGPATYTLRELVQYAGKLAGCPRPIMTLGRSLGMIQARLFECGLLKLVLGRQLLSRDNLRTMEVANVSSAPFPFGIRPSALETESGYLTGVFPRSRYNAFRYRAGRSPGFMQR